MDYRDYFKKFDNDPEYQAIKRRLWLWLLFDEIVFRLRMWIGV